MAPGIIGLVFVAMGAIPAGMNHGFLVAVASSQDSSISVPNAELAFRPSERAVTNWRLEAAENLDLKPDFKTRLTEGNNAPEVPRCVKLNNYWCIKRAGWAGEIAADTEGHVAFASAMDGAVAAAILIRRYYQDYNRHSASAILSRWAPAQCTTMTAGLRPIRKRGATTQLDTLGGVAPLGIQNTLRARWLAAHGRGFPNRGKALASHASVVPSRPLALMRAPEIAVGMGESERTPVTVRIAALELPTSAPPPTSPPPPKSAPPRGPSCLGESERIRNYTLRAIEGIAASPDDDLNLFAADRTPSANLARLLENMAKVEIGPLGARAGLIAAAIDVVFAQGRAAKAPTADTPPSGGPSADSRQGQ